MVKCKITEPRRMALATESGRHKNPKRYVVKKLLVGWKFAYEFYVPKDVAFCGW